MTILSKLGLMRVSEHEAFVQAAGVALTNSETDLKKAERHFQMALSERDTARNQRGEAWTTIKTQADEIERLALGWKKCGDELNEAKKHIDHLGITFNQRLADEVQDYQNDALAMRAKRKRDRDMKAAKRVVK